MAAREDREEMAELNNIQALPEKYRQLWVTNKRLTKQIDIMRMEISEKDRIIRELKVQIDSSILEDTKHRLEFVRIVEEEVSEKTKEVTSEYLRKMAEFDQEIEREIRLKACLEEQLAKERQHSSKLNAKVQQLKESIISALAEKDDVIDELVKLVSSKSVQTKMEAPNPQEKAYEGKKLAPSKVYIKRNM